MRLHMTRLHKTLLIIGLLLMTGAMIRVFGGLTSLIPTDKYFFITFFSGLLGCCLGFFIESCLIIPMSSYQLRRKKQLKKQMGTAIIFLLIAVAMILIQLKTSK